MILQLSLASIIYYKWKSLESINAIPKLMNEFGSNKGVWLAAMNDLAVMDESGNNEWV